MLKDIVKNKMYLFVGTVFVSNCTEKMRSLTAKGQIAKVKKI